MAVSSGLLRARSGRCVLALFLLANLVYLAMLFYSIPQVMSHAKGMPLFDLSPSGYSHEQALALLNALGEEGRKAYLFPQLLLDVFYPALFALSYSSLLQWIRQRANLKPVVWGWLGVLPFAVCLFDYGENFMVWRMLISYPDLSASWVAVASAFTVVKSVLTSLYFLGLLVALMLWIRHRIVSKAKGN